MVQIPFQWPIQAPVAYEGVVGPTNTGNGGYNAYYGGGESYAIGDEHDEHDVGHNPYGGIA